MKGTGNIASVLLIILAMGLLDQCAPRTGRSLLTIFFDGVPVADSAEMDPVGADSLLTDSVGHVVEAAAEREDAMLAHYPYEERECAACHDQRSLGDMVEPEPGLCYVCHEDFGDAYAYLHGPVAGGYCTACHDPHMSENEKLLRHTGEQLCLYCHQSEDVLQNEMHQDLEGMACTDCHNPHGGEDRFIFY